MTWRNIYVGVVFAELSSLNMNGIETVDEGFVDSLAMENEEEVADSDSDSESELPNLDETPPDEGLGCMLDEWEDILSGWMKNPYVKVKFIANTQHIFFC